MCKETPKKRLLLAEEDHLIFKVQRIMATSQAARKRIDALPQLPLFRKIISVAVFTLVLDRKPQLMLRLFFRQRFGVRKTMMEIIVFLSERSLLLMWILLSGGKIKVLVKGLKFTF